MLHTVSAVVNHPRHADTLGHYVHSCGDYPAQRSVECEAHVACTARITRTPRRRGVCSNGEPAMMDRMPPRIVRLSGIERVDLPVARQSVPPLHAYLRACILDGRLPPGTRLSQSTLADQLGVSRTPLREVLRMLQDEGLVTAEPNQRMRVAGLDPVELDSDYAARILLATLALSMTAGDFGAAERRRAQSLLSGMRRAARHKDIDGWLRAHSDFHGLLETGAPEPLRKQ